MVQREYARRMRARPGTPDYSSLSVFVQHFCAVEHLFDAGASGFYPAPRVASSVIKLRPHAHVNEGLADPALLLWLVRAAFAQRRKTLANSVAAQPGAPSNAILIAALQQSRLPGAIRGERLAHDDFVTLANALSAQGFRAPAR
ncbi:MAG: 16S rRNA (adenine(1518)-N(6)/adenine(1519)-N(6))-dimethyltransferase, partial [Candidatus Eremiobacteraeota bacterium]|nr:16S rRNA (adenine(1518)-N(6)/adenine(1519)-N(6))-dimethyltransferase [Candidatus Eremiobacteraeota bacterium]